MKRSITTFNLIVILLLSALHNMTLAQEDYQRYHLQVIEAEQYIASDDYPAALRVYEQLLDNYEFIFLREYKIMAQIALYLDDELKSIAYLKLGMENGWTYKAIRKNKFFTPLKSRKEWKDLKKEYTQLRAQYESSLNQELRAQVQEMFSKDQKKALGALLKIGQKAKERYALNIFAAHSEQQLVELKEILNLQGYPGERFIGNNYWMSTILSHHNSISQAYNEQDQHYQQIKPLLIQALGLGQISPFELAVIDDWYISVVYNRSKPTYGILDRPKDKDLGETNNLRRQLFLRPYELRLQLQEQQNKTAMDFELPELWY